MVKVLGPDDHDFWELPVAKEDSEKSRVDRLFMSLFSNIPSGKRLHNYRKSQFSMGKSTINGHFQ